MVGEKGLEPSVADKIGEYVKLKGGMELVELLTADEALSNNKSAKAALEDMKLLLQYVDLFGITDKVTSSSKMSPHTCNSFLLQSQVCVLNLKAESGLHFRCLSI